MSLPEDDRKCKDDYVIFHSNTYCTHSRLYCFLNFQVIILFSILYRYSKHVCCMRVLFVDRWRHGLWFGA